MSVAQFVLDSDAAGGQGQFLLVSDSATAIAIQISVQQAQQAVVSFSLPPAIAVTAQQPQQTSLTLISWAYVTLVAPIYTGPGSVAYNGQFVGSPPQAGDIVAYDPTIVTVNTDGTISSTQYGTAQAQYNDGTGWVPFTITVAAWDVNPQQPQQAAMGVSVAAAVAITAQQRQQIAIDILPISGIAITPFQQQQVSVAVVTRAVLNFASQQQQQENIAVAAQMGVAFSDQQPQQMGSSISTRAAIGFAAQQPQQAAISVVVPQPLAIAMTAAQQQQGAANFVVQTAIALTVAQPQQAAVNVLVPPPVIIALTVAQPQQALINVAASQTLGITAQQSQQENINASASPAAAFTSQQRQQISVVLPNLPSPAIAVTAQQRQQVTADILIFPQIVFANAQPQQSDFAIIPLPAQLVNLDPEGVTFDFGLASYTNSQLDTKVIYIGRDNTAQLGVFYYGLPLDLGAITQIQIELLGTNIIIDSNGAPDYMRWQPGSNQITFKLGLVPDILPGIYPIAMVIYDYAHPEGQVIAGPGLPVVKFDFEQDRVA